MATNNALNTSLSGQSGTGSFAGTASPTFTGTSTFATVAFTNPATGGILGTTTNDSAAAGYVGRIVESTVLVGSAVSLTTNITADITTISLPAGDWDVWGLFVTNPNAATTINAIAAWINTTSVTAPTLPAAGARFLSQGPFTTGGVTSTFVGYRRLSLSGTTTVYLSCQVGFGVNTMAGYGYLGARIRR